MTPESFDKGLCSISLTPAPISAVVSPVPVFCVLEFCVRAIQFTGMGRSPDPHQTFSFCLALVCPASTFPIFKTTHRITDLLIRGRIMGSYYRQSKFFGNSTIYNSDVLTPIYSLVLRNIDLGPSSHLSRTPTLRIESSMFVIPRPECKLFGMARQATIPSSRSLHRPQEVTRLRSALTRSFGRIRSPRMDDLDRNASSPSSRPTEYSCR